MANRPHLPFQATVGALALVFLAGCALAYYAYESRTQADTDLRRVTSAVNALVSGAALPEGGEPVALNADNVAAAAADLAALQARQEALRNAIAGSSESQIDSRFVGIANELGTQIQESVTRWRRLAQSKDVKLPSREEICFGFRRYVLNRGTQPQRLYREVDRQRKMIEWILETLVAAKDPSAPLLIQSIDREPIETFPSVAGPAGESQVFTLDTPSSEVLSVRLQSDEFVLSGHSFRRPGLVGSFAFRVRFVGRSDTLRAFVNLVQNSGKPVAISGIEVIPPPAETLKELFSTGANLAAPAAPVAVPAPFFANLGPATSADAPAPPTKAERLPVVPTGASEYTVRLEYLFPVTETPAAPAK